MEGEGRGKERRELREDRGSSVSEGSVALVLLLSIVVGISSMYVMFGCFLSMLIT